MHKIIQVLDNSDIKTVVGEYKMDLEKDPLDFFNVFTLTSDLYYRENYHSDILSAFLRYKDAETGKYILLEAFIEMLNDSRRNTSKITIDIYKDHEKCEK